MAESTHDYRAATRGWGHDYTYTPSDEGLRARMMGWGRGIRQNDYLLLTNPSTGGTPRYRVINIAYAHDPPDMWRAEVVYDPVPAPEEVR
jgi:hypothetical protein